MSYRFVDSNALNIPGRMDLDELAFLAALAANVPKDGHIVEVGAFYGRSTNAMAHANPDATITSIDTFEDVAWTERYASQFRGVPKFGRKAFDHFTSAHKNITPIQGFSPDCALSWDRPIDLYFEDAIHGNPGLKRNIEFWTQHLVPGGIACGHDYNRKFPDIKSEVAGLADAWNTEVAIVGSLWALRKPDHFGRRTVPVDLQISNAPQLTVRGANKRRGNVSARAGFWCGAHLEADRLNWLLIDADPDLGDTQIMYRLAHPEFGETAWTNAGQKAQLVCNGKARPFTAIAVKCVGENEQKFHVNYRVSARQIGNGGSRLSGTSPWFSDGQWARVSTNSPAINAVTIELSQNLPEDPQSKFAKKPKHFLTKIHKAVNRKILVRA